MTNSHFLQKFWLLSSHPLRPPARRICVTKLFSYTNAESSKNYSIFKQTASKTLLAGLSSSRLTPIPSTFTWSPGHQQWRFLSLYKYESTNWYEYPQEATDGDCASSLSLDLRAAPQICLEGNVFPRWPEGWRTAWGQRSKRVCKGVARCWEEGERLKGEGWGQQMEHLWGPDEDSRGPIRAQNK